MKPIPIIAEEHEQKLCGEAVRKAWQHVIISCCQESHSPLTVPVGGAGTGKHPLNPEVLTYLKAALARWWTPELECYAYVSPRMSEAATRFRLVMRWPKMQVMIDDPEDPGRMCSIETWDGAQMSMDYTINDREIFNLQNPRIPIHKLGRPKPAKIEHEVDMSNGMFAKLMKQRRDT